MKPNKYAGRCVACGETVPPGQGILKFCSVHHRIGNPRCPDAEKFWGYTNFPEDRKQIAETFSCGPVYHENFHGHEVDSIVMPNGDVVSKQTD